MIRKHIKSVPSYPQVVMVLNKTLPYLRDPELRKEVETIVQEAMPELLSIKAVENQVLTSK